MRNKIWLKNVVRNIVTLFIALFLFFIIAEAISRFISSIDERIKNSFQYISYPNGQPPRGFRSPVPSSPKPEHTFRIVALGDSYTWGDFISNTDDIWTSVLQKNLQNNFSDKRIEVINLGIRGFTTVNELETLQKIGLNIDPDVIILQFTLNDPLPSKGFKRVGGKWLKKETLNIIPYDFMHKKFISSSKFYEFLNDRFKVLQYRITGTTKYDQLYKEDFKGWIACQKSLYTISELAHTRGIDVILMIPPYLIKGIWTKETYPYQALYTKIITVGKRANMHVINLLPKFVEQKKDFRTYHALKGHDAHPNVIAHRLFADTLEEYLITNNLIE